MASGGYIYDWFAGQWLPRQHRELSHAERHQRARREQLLRYLLPEMQHGDSTSQLYAGLLARCLLSADQELMREYGEQVAKQGKKADRAVA